jgi:hypothetical protein
MLRYPDYTRTRLKQLGDRIAGLIYTEKQPIDQLLVSGPVGRIAYDEAQKLEFRPALVNLLVSRNGASAREMGRARGASIVGDLFGSFAVARWRQCAGP